MLFGSSFLAICWLWKVVILFGLCSGDGFDFVWPKEDDVRFMQVQGP